MKARTLTALAAALALSASTLGALPVNAGEPSEQYASMTPLAIAYTESEGSLGVGDNGVSLRRNIYNVWGNEVTDIDGATSVNGYVTVKFEVSGIGTDSELVNEEDGTTEPYYVFLGGSIAGVSYHQKEYNNGTVPENQCVAITGDGSYTVTWEETYSENIDCLYLQSNINIYAYGEDVETVADTTANIKVTYIGTCEAAQSVFGDVNDDGAVNASDAAKILISAAAAGGGATEGLIPADKGDFNDDATVNASDAAIVLMYSAAVGGGYEGTLSDYLKK